MRRTRSQARLAAGSPLSGRVFGRRRNNSTIVITDSSEDSGAEGDVDRPVRLSNRTTDRYNPATHSQQKRQRIGGTYAGQQQQAQIKNHPHMILACQRFKMNDLIPRLNAKQREDIEQIGFGGLLQNRLDDIPEGMNQWLMSAFNPDTSEIKVGDKTLYRLTTADVCDTFLLPTYPGKPVDEVADNRVRRIRSRWWKEYRITCTPNTRFSLKDLLEIMLGLGDGGPDFLRMFVVYIVSTLFAPVANGTADFRPLKSCVDIGAVQSYDWCGYILDKTRAAAKRFISEGQLTFSGCFHVLLLPYVQRTAWGDFAAPCRRPFIGNWTSESLGRRINKEAETCGFGILPLNNADYPITRDCIEPAVRFPEDFWDDSKLSTLLPNEFLCDAAKLVRDLNSIVGDRIDHLFPLPESLLDQQLPSCIIGSVLSMSSSVDRAIALLTKSKELFLELARQHNQVHTPSENDTSNQSAERATPPIHQVPPFGQNSGNPPEGGTFVARTVGTGLISSAAGEATPTPSEAIPSEGFNILHPLTETNLNTIMEQLQETPTQYDAFSGDVENLDHTAFQLPTPLRNPSSIQTLVSTVTQAPIFIKDSPELREALNGIHVQVSEKSMDGSATPDRTIQHPCHAFGMTEHQDLLSPVLDNGHKASADDQTKLHQYETGSPGHGHDSTANEGQQETIGDAITTTAPHQMDDDLRLLQDSQSSKVDEMAKKHKALLLAKPGVDMQIVPYVEQHSSYVDAISDANFDDIEAAIDNFSFSNTSPHSPETPVHPDPWTTWPVNKAKTHWSTLVQRLTNKKRSTALPSYKLEIADFCIAEFNEGNITRIKATPYNVRGSLLEMHDFRSLEYRSHPTASVVTAWARLLNRHVGDQFPSNCVCLDAIPYYNCDDITNKIYAHWSAGMKICMRDLTAAQLVFVPCYTYACFALILLNFKAKQLQYLDSSVHKSMDKREFAAKDIRSHLSAWLHNRHPQAEEILNFQINFVAGEWRGGARKRDDGIYVMHLMNHYRGDTSTLASAPLIQTTTIEELRASFCCDLVLSPANSNKQELLTAIPHYISEKINPPSKCN